MKKLEDFITNIPDYPAPGIIFRDITTLISDPEGFRMAIEAMKKDLEGVEFDAIAGLESRGFIFGAPLAYELNKSFVLVRKKGKLPRETVSRSYQLEYGTAEVEMHVDAIRPGDRVVIVDDLIATGGTLRAGCELVEALGGKVVKIATLIELPALKGRQALAEYDISSVVQFDGE